jgi:hypothetical protein
MNRSAERIHHAARISGNRYDQFTLTFRVNDFGSSGHSQH